MARGTATQVNNVTHSRTVSNNVSTRDNMLGFKIAIPLVAAVVIIAAVLALIFIRRKRRNDKTQSAKALNSLQNVPEGGKHVYSADNVAFTPDYDMALEDREYNYVQSNSSEKGLSDYTYANPTKGHQVSREKVGGMQNVAASSGTEYDYTCSKQMSLVGHDQAVYNHLGHGQPMSTANVSDSTYDTNQFPILQCKSDPSDYDHLGRRVAKITDNHGDEKSYDHLPNPDQSLPRGNSQPFDPTYNQLGSV
ncbi:uncharacterized protein LOC127862400 isoform X2 [Dreissena polymorpha]|nr:uncharacterized protein LOC127862400 isoform X2 [Dreissena polymorpha]